MEKGAGKFLRTDVSEHHYPEVASQSYPPELRLPTEDYAKDSPLLVRPAIAVVWRGRKKRRSGDGSGCGGGGFATGSEY
jgi:hypothetical protein